MLVLGAGLGIDETFIDRNDFHRNSVVLELTTFCFVFKQARMELHHERRNGRLLPNLSSHKVVD